MKGLKFEVKKALTQKKTWFMLILVLLYCIGLVFVLNRKEKDFLAQQQRYNQNTIEEYSGLLSMARIKIMDLEYREPENHTEIAKQEREAEFYQHLYSKSLLSEEIYNKMALRKELSQSELSILFMNNKSMDQVILNGYIEGVVDESWMEERSLTQEKLEKQITDYENIEVLDIKYEPNPYVLNAKNYIKFFLQQMNIFIILVLILFISINDYEGEIEEGSYKLIYTSPWNRKSLLLSKYIVRSIVNLLLIVIPVSIVILMIGLSFGWGNMLYPVRVSEEAMKLSLLLISNNETYISTSGYLGFQTIGFIFIIIFQTIIGVSLSVLLEDSSTSFGLVLGIMIVSFIGSMLDNILAVQVFFNPWIFMDFTAILSINTKVSMYYGIILQLLIMIIVTMYTSYIFNKRDLIGGKS